VQFITDLDPLLLQLGIILGIPWSKQKALKVNRKMAPFTLMNRIIRMQFIHVLERT